METKNTKKKTTAKAKAEVKEKDVKEVKTHPLLKSPRVTEKSAINAEKGIYTFNVILNANKNEIKKAIKIVYGVKPVRVTITKIADKKVVRRGEVSIKRGGKKAVVYLKKGDKIIFA